MAGEWSLSRVFPKIQMMSIVMNCLTDFPCLPDVSRQVLTSCKRFGAVSITHTDIDFTATDTTRYLL